MVIPMLMLMLIADADADSLMLMLTADDLDADADADAVAGLLNVSLKLPGKMRQTSTICRLVPIDVYIEGRGSSPVNSL